MEKDEWSGALVLVKEEVVAIDVIEAGGRSLQVGEEPGGVRYGKEIWDVNCGGEFIRTMGEIFVSFDEEELEVKENTLE